MKKLMIAMGAAAMMSLCAQAKPQGGVSLATGTDFEGYTGNEGKFSITMDDTGNTEGTKFWAQRAAGDTVDSKLITTNSNTYLKVEETEELTRLIDVNEGVASNATVSADSGIYFSSKVQFTAADDAPPVSNNVDKIIVWAKAPKDDPGEGDPTTTNLMVTALNPKTAQPDAFDTGITVDAESWYDLEIVASRSAEDALSPISFTVTLKKGDDVAVRGPFLSMVTSGDASGTISSASFKGTGAVDDIDWGTVAAVEPTMVKVSYTVTPPTLVYLNVDGAEYDNEKGVAVGKTITFLVGAPSASTVTADGLTFEWDGDAEAFVAEYTITAADGQAGTKAFAITVTGGGEGPTITPSNGDTEIDIEAESKEDAEAAAIAAIQAPEGVDPDDYRGYFTATAGEPDEGVYTVTVALDPGEVTPEIDGADEDLDIAGGVITVETKAGLYYQLVRGATPTTIATDTPIAEVAGDGSTLSLTDAHPLAGAAFYKVTVTADQQINEN